MKQRLTRLISAIGGLFARGLARTARPLSDDREAIWSIPKPFKRAYYAWVMLLWTPTLVVVILEKIPAAVAESWWLRSIAVIRASGVEFAPVGISVAIAGLVAVHGGMLIVSLYQAIVNRFITPVIEDHREEGRVEGQAETNRQWREWLQRRTEAEAQGLPFDEPQPGEEQ